MARVLVVDDSDANRQLASAQLKRLGHAISVAQTGREAIDALRKQDFDIVFMDWHMPDLDGLEVIRHWRKEHDPEHLLPIITITASAMVGDRHRCLEAGASDYLSKPVSIEDLRSTIDRWTGLVTPEVPAPPTAPDTSIAALIEDLGAVDVLESVVEAFTSMVPIHRSTATQAHRIGDRATIRRSAHTLKSTAQMLGIAELAHACRVLEEEAIDPTVDLDAAMATFNGSCDQAATTLAGLASQIQHIVGLRS